MLIWSTSKEMTDTLNNVRDYCKSLKTEIDKSSEETPAKKDEVEEVTPLAPGIDEDLALHSKDKLRLEPVVADPNYRQPSPPQERSDASISRSMLVMNGKSASRVISDEDGLTSNNASDEKDSSEEEESEQKPKVEEKQNMEVEQESGTISKAEASSKVED